MDRPDPLAAARESYRQRAWGEAHRSLRVADQTTPLDAGDLERLATSAYLIGHEDDFLRALDRAHHAHLESGEPVRAARAAFWLGLGLLLRGETGRATGWLARARRLLEHRDCVEQGYLRLPLAEQQLADGDHEGAYASASEAVSIGERFGEADLTACARHLQGRALILQGRVRDGLELLDEAMVAVTAGELSPIVTGLLYCSVIEACERVYALGRTREWTAALARWCEPQPEMVAFTGLCLVHRARIVQLRGAWLDALDEARRACERFARRPEPGPLAEALYLQAEVHRLRGEYAASEDAYRDASRWGCEPQPGLALLRLAQGRTHAAAAAMRRAVRVTTDPLRRTRLLPAHIEIMLAAGDGQEARRACRELEEIAAQFDTGVLGALAAQARGAVELAEGDAQAALATLRRAWEAWQRLGAPYEAARVRLLVGLAHDALGDDDGAALELGAARAVFLELGAAPDVARLDAHARRASRARHRLTDRELQVLRLVAAGKTNKVIAAELRLSEKTVDRHVSNIFDKLDVSSRAGATAYAYRNRLV
jgi:DNA-binding CsgD family transcriptional regulator